VISALPMAHPAIAPNPAPLSPLRYTDHALHRWLQRAPRMIRSIDAFRDALATARFHRHVVRQAPDGAPDEYDEYVALGMRLCVRGGAVVTVMQCRPGRDARRR
jgi:hypothetical protein